MDMKEFRRLGIRTEAPITDDVSRRLVRTYPMFSEQLSEEVHLGGFLDKCKKYIFYNRQDGAVEDQLPPVWPTGEKRERIQQMARILHGIIGVGTEHGELAEEILAHIDDGKPLDVEHIAEEVFDILWYLNLILDAINTSIPEVAERGIAKLRERYKDKFTEEAAAVRDTTAEMAAFSEVQVDKNSFSIG